MEPFTPRVRTVLCDWGTSRLRAYLQIGAEVIARCEGPGIGALKSSASAALQDTLRPWRSAGGFEQIVACGMVGSRNGIVEVPYVQAPAGFSAWASQAHAQAADDIPLLIAAGIRAANAAGEPDVMRGEETQIFGAIANDEALAHGAHLILLPGTHSKWVQVLEGRITRVQTYITGELFAVLRDHSSLLRAGDSGEPPSGGFLTGLAHARRSGLGSSLFQTRAAQLAQARPRAWAQEFLSGLLIGDEVTTALRASAPTAVVIVGERTLAERYQQALALEGVRVSSLDGEDCALAGLRLLASHHRRAR